jgi:hypothetical protein
VRNVPGRSSDDSASPTKINRGAEGMARSRGTWARMSRNARDAFECQAHRSARHSGAEPRRSNVARPPAGGSKPAKGGTPGAPPDGDEGRTRTVRPGRGARGTMRVRNAACEKRPPRMTRPRTGKREPAPAGVVGRSEHVATR